MPAEEDRKTHYKAKTEHGGGKGENSRENAKMKIEADVEKEEKQYRKGKEMKGKMNRLQEGSLQNGTYLRWQAICL